MAPAEKKGDKPARASRPGRTKASGDGQVAMTSGTGVGALIFDYGSSGYRYRQVARGGETGFSIPTFDDSSWLFGTGAFGTTGCAGTPAPATAWSPNTDMLVRRTVYVGPAGLPDLNLHIGIDNDIDVYWNGALVASRNYEGCGVLDKDVISIPSQYVVPGANTLAVRAIDRGQLTYLDLRLVSGVLPGLPLEQTYGMGCNSSGAPAPYQLLTDRPVNTATGALTERYRDIDLPGVGVRCEFSRSYTSLDTTAGPLGPGWTHPFNMSVSENQTTGAVRFRAENGQQVVYEPDGQSGYLTPPGARSTLAEGPGGVGWVLTKPDQSTLSFNAAGRLTAMKDRLGEGLTFTHANGELASVTDAAGRVVAFTHSNGLLTRVTLEDGRYVEYGYTGGRLTSVRDLRGKTTSYAYDTGGRLESMTDPLGHRQFFNVYDPTTGRVIEQTDARGMTTLFDWDPVTETATRTDPKGREWVEVYQDNVLLSMSDPLGNTTSFGYDDRLNRTRVTDARGNTTTFTYDAAGNLETKTAPAPLSHAQRWTYTAFNDVATHTNGRGKTTTYDYYPATHLLQRVTDPLNRVTEFTYTPRGLLDTVTDPRDQVTDYGYDTDGNRTSVLSPEGNLTTFGFDDYGRMESLTEPRGNAAGANPAHYTTEYAYDDGNLLVSVTDALDRVTQYDYDDAGNLDLVTDADLKVTDYDYNEHNQISTATDPRGGEVVTSYDDNGNVEVVTTPAGTTQYTYDLANRVKTEITPRGNVAGANPAQFTWTYGYDANGNQTSAAHPTAGTTVTTFDKVNRPTAVTNALNKATTYGYDANSNLLTVRDPLNRTTNYGYDAADQVDSVTDPLNKTIDYGYDLSGNRTSATTPLGHERRWSFDGDGRLATEIDPRGTVSGADPAQYTTSYGYDPAGHLLTMTDPHQRTTSYSYDRVGNLDSRTDANQHTTSYGYDDLNRLETVTGPAGTNVGTTTYDYDDAGNLTNRVDAKQHTTTYTYDLAGRLDTKTTPVGTWDYGYDAAGNLTTIETPAGASTPANGDGTITRTYDPVNRLKTIDYSDATSDVTYGYNALRLTSMADGAGTETFGYDDAGQLQTVTRGTSVFDYDYDTDGRLITRTLPGGVVVSQTWDDDDRIDTVSTTHNGTPVSADYGYDEAGNRTSTSFENGIIENRAYDRAGWLDDISVNRGGGVAAHHAITRDDVGNPTHVIHTYDLLTIQHEVLEYDHADRLTRVCFANTCGLTNPSISYTYDPVGNRETEVRANLNKAGTWTSTYNDADQLTQTSKPGTLLDPAVTTGYGYDTNGNQTTAGARTFTYDLAGRTTSTTAAAVTTSYGYDGNGLRLSATTGATTTDYTWDTNHTLPELVAETTTTGSRRFLNDPAGDPIALTNPGTDNNAGTFYLHPDNVGTIRFVTSTSTSGSSTAIYAYEPFGASRDNALSQGNGLPNPVRFAGEYQDPTTGLYHLRARDYDPTTGRFTALDPLAQDVRDPYVAGYLYTANRPTSLVDPSGRTASQADEQNAEEVCFDADEWYLEPGELICQLSQQVLNTAGGAVEGTTSLVDGGLNVTGLGDNMSITNEVRDWFECSGLSDPTSGMYFAGGFLGFGKGLNKLGKLDELSDAADDARVMSNLATGRIDEAHETYDAARRAAQGRVGDLGADARHMYDPETGTLIGQMSADGKRGWRIDEDHFNFWDWTGGKKGSGGVFGHDFFPTGVDTPHSKHIGYAGWE